MAVLPRPERAFTGPLHVCCRSAGFGADSFSGAGHGRVLGRLDRARHPGVLFTLASPRIRNALPFFPPCMAAVSRHLVGPVPHKLARMLPPAADADLTKGPPQVTPVRAVLMYQRFGGISARPAQSAAAALGTAAGVAFLP